MKIAICDDDKGYLADIKAKAEQYASKYLDSTVQICEFDNALVFLEEMNKNGGFDIALLDIYMPGILGTDVAREIRERGEKTEIIFLTTSDKFAVDAFALKAVHYIIKPFTLEIFQEAMDRAVSTCKQKEKKNILIKTVSGVRTVDIDTIIYVESYRHYKTVHLAGGETIESRMPLSEFVAELDALSEKQFITPYKGYIVNQQYILEIRTKDIVLKNNAKIPLVSRNAQAVKDNYFRFVFEE